ncbi:DUF4114 domain-containing protein [Leptolyngbyaceae cyanobacterium CCMR0082]|uniref:DUF4114 domain-containing protein n=1 Tax=Adonisia turfae CCMR0082 TaxID=2304604 RepID=A0A6M0SDE3_9CYAN|nr:DUF4114 domain-containing protein [Adonisia turfae]NEZ66346.1 DUF4114 domain-containing protein [Adonisia turfae CCMR0082]
METFDLNQDLNPLSVNSHLDSHALPDNNPLGLPKNSTPLELSTPDIEISDPQVIEPTLTTVLSEADLWEADSAANTTDLITHQPDQNTFTSLEAFSIDDLTGVFTVEPTGEITTDFLFDAGGYKSELAIISLEGMENLSPGSTAFIQEGARRGLSGSPLGHILISDRDEGARFSGELGEKNRNRGDYNSPRTVSMNPGDRVALMLVPDGTLSQIADQPNLQGIARPLFSLTAANPSETAQLAQVTGNLFSWEDLSLDGVSDRDYNDIIFQLQGATGTATAFETLVATDKDWRDLDLGRILIDHASLEHANPPQITVRLANDTGFDSTDGITSDFSISGLVTGTSLITALRAKWGSSPGSNFVDILSVLEDDGRFTLTSAQLEQIKGNPIVDGEQRLLVQAIDAANNFSETELVFTLDTTAPKVVGGPSSLSPDFIDVSFSEPMEAGGSDLDNYILKRADNDGDGQAIAITSVEQLDSQTLRLYFSTSLATGQYELTVDPSVVDLAGNSLSDSDKLDNFSQLSPSKVGKVYLSDAAQAFQDLGQLSGVAIDEITGKLILISKDDDDDDINSSPLRLDDFVTIFRSVYEEGQAPYVTIDPNPEDPEGDFIVLHDPATDDTYVGWTLFEADRIMKTYSLGVDNVTEEPFTSLVPGYKNLFDPDFQGTNDVDKAIFERFWIVPAELSRDQAQGEDKSLTLLDVTLKVNTERIILDENGLLVTAPDPTPSEGAAYFANWFTENYDAIAQEVQLSPPAESGIEGTVSPFTETEGMALITGVAEVLQEQGIFMPDWMQEYEVSPVDVTDTTPKITVTETTEEETAEGVTETTTQEIDGGVSLEPEIVATQRNDSQTVALSENLFEIVESEPLLSTVNFGEALGVQNLSEADLAISTQDGAQLSFESEPANFEESFNGIILPTDDTEALGGQNLSETDLVIPMQNGTVLSLERSFHSFFAPDGILGNSWTLDLPTLEEEFSTYQFSSPLKTQSARFIPDEDGFLQPNNPDELFPLLVGNDDRIGTDTTLVRFQDGREWHFDTQDQLLGWVEGVVAVVYKRNAQNQIETIEGWYGNTLQATIELTYNTNDQLQSATGSNDSVVNYVYNASGQLASVTGPNGLLEYTYNEQGLVTGIQQDDALTALFTYDTRGQLTSEWVSDDTSDGTTLIYGIQYLDEGIQLIITDVETQAMVNILYDFDLQPLQQTFSDGEIIYWL